MLYIAHSIGYNVVMRIEEQLAKAIEKSGLSRYRICKDLGINQGVLHRIVHGTGGCNMDTLNELCDYLDLKLTSKKGGK